MRSADLRESTHLVEVVVVDVFIGLWFNPHSDFPQNLMLSILPCVFGVLTNNHQVSAAATLGVFCQSHAVLG